VAVVSALFSACGGNAAPPTMQSPLAGTQQTSHHKLDVDPACLLAYTDASGSHYAAHIGVNNSLSLDYASAPCEIGIYIGAASLAEVLDHTSINGAYKQAIFIDGAKNFHIDHLRIDNAAATGVFARNESGLSIDHAFIMHTPIGLESSISPNTPDADITINHTDISAYTTFGMLFSHTNVIMQHSTAESDGNADPGENGGSTEGFRFYYADAIDLDHNRAEANHLDFHFICSKGEITENDLTQGHNTFTETLNECAPAATPTPRFHPTPSPSSGPIS
jgi:hypothetical protein